MGYKFPLDPIIRPSRKGNTSNFSSRERWWSMLRSRLVSFTEPLRKALPKERLFAIWLSGENLRYLLFSSQLGILFGGREGGGLGSSGKSRIHSCFNS